MDRAKRVRRLKKMILFLLAAGFIIPTVLCIYVLFRISALENKLDRTLEELSVRKQEAVEAREQVMEVSVQARRAAADNRAAEILKREKAGRSVQEVRKADPAALSREAKREIYLTFDDGPSCYTAEILDILKEYGVKATFFVIGRRDEQSLAMYRRIVEEGHTLGMHSYSHKYSEIYASEEAFAEDMTRLSDLLYQATGVRPKVCRFPGGSSNRVSSVDMDELFQWLERQGIIYFDWNMSSGDAASVQISTQQIVQNCTNGLEGHKRAMILMHDAANKHTTVEALPIIIEYGLNLEDTVFLPITEDTVPIQHRT